MGDSARGKPRRRPKTPEGKKRVANDVERGREKRTRVARLGAIENIYSSWRIEAILEGVYGWRYAERRCVIWDSTQWANNRNRSTGQLMLMAMDVLENFPSNTRIAAFAAASRNADTDAMELFTVSRYEHWRTAHGHTA